MKLAAGKWWERPDDAAMPGMDPGGGGSSRYFHQLLRPQQPSPLSPNSHVKMEHHKMSPDKSPAGEGAEAGGSGSGGGAGSRSSPSPARCCPHRLRPA